MKAPQVFFIVSLFTSILIMVLNYQSISLYERWEIQNSEYAISHDKVTSDSVVCRDIFEIGKHSPNMSDMIDVGVSVISHRKKERRFLHHHFYDIIGYAQPHMAMTTAEGRGLNGTNVAVNKQWRLQQVGGRLPHLACSLREYSGKDIGTCVGLRAKAGKTTHIMYIGDSRIRQHIEVLLDHMRDLDFIITTYQGQVITVEDFLGQKGSKQWFKYKHNFRVETSSSPRFILDYHWASDIQKRGNAREAEAAGKLPNYHVGAIDLLNTLKDAPEGTLPDLILLNTGAWQLMDIKGNIIDQVDSTAIEVMQVLYPLLNHLSELTTVVWALPDSFKEFMLHDFGSTGKYTQQTNAILEWVLNGQAQLLPPRVLVWDSFLPVSHAALSDCIMFLSKNLDIKKLPAYSIFKPEITWHCTERMHVGFEALFVAAQMTINHICNPFMDEKGYCCST